jgi:hypothetical protein
MNQRQDRNSEAYKEARRQYAKNWNKNHQGRQVASNKRYRQKTKQWFVELKSTMKCNRCPESAFECLDFHHSDPTEKEHNIHKMVGFGYGREAILAEIAKCEVLCANCHRKHHAAEQKQGK